MTDIGPNESSLTGTDTRNPALVARAKEFDARPSTEARDLVVVNGAPVDLKALRLQQPTPVKPAAPAPAKPSETPKSIAIAPATKEAADAWLAREREFDSEGVTALTKEWGGDLLPNLGYARHAARTLFTDEERQLAYRYGVDGVGAMRLLAAVGRRLKHDGTPAALSATKGDKMSEFNFSGSPAELQEQLADLNRQFHDEYLKNGLSIEAKRIDAKRTALYRATVPGMNAPAGVF